MRTILILIASLVAGAPGAVAALEVAGVKLAETVVESATGKKLALNGAGIRTKFFFDIYVGALYLETKSTSAQDILRMPGPKRVEMHFVYDEVSAEKMASGWNDGFEANNTETELAPLADRIGDFAGMFPSMKEGDVVVIDFRSGGGTMVDINGERLGTIPGADFNRALLRVWLGDSPPNTDLKEGMLGLDQ